jgi:hypothetical protein
MLGKRGELMPIICGKCKKHKEESEFYKSTKEKRGYYRYCKECCKENNIESREKFRDKRNAERRQYAKDHPEQNRNNALNHRKKLKAEQPARYRAKKFFDVHRKDVSPEVTKEYLEYLFLTVKTCQCCGKALTLEYEERASREYRSNPNSPSIDRVNNNEGYSKDNIAVICWECNYRKTDLTLSDLIMLEAYIRRCGKHV